MKVVEPVSSALLLTACVYSAGTSQNNAFLRAFRLSPEFSQPSLDKIFYDGGIILYEILFGFILSIWSIIIDHPIYTLIISFIIIITIKKITTSRYSPAIKKVVSIVTSWGSIGFIALLMGLSFIAYEKGQKDGSKIAEIYLKKCYEVRITSDEKTSTGCAFRKDKDSIWYYTTNKKFQVFSETLTETKKIEYLSPRPVINDEEAVNQLYRSIMK